MYSCNFKTTCTVNVMPNTCTLVTKINQTPYENAICIDTKYILITYILKKCIKVISNIKDIMHIATVHT